MKKNDLISQLRAISGLFFRFHRFDFFDFFEIIVLKSFASGNTHHQAFP